jgi:predicted Rossmann fold flavoprotein
LDSVSYPREKVWDAIVIGAGGAGLFCAAQAGQRGLSVINLDHASKLGKKILISGGGRCNFTNKGASWSQYQSENEHFAKSALARYTSQDFLSLVESYGVPHYEKKLGQLFCQDTAQRIVKLLMDECEKGNVQLQYPVEVQGVERISGEGNTSSAWEDGARYSVKTNGPTILGRNLVIATGGLSVPKIGATDFGHRLARNWGLRVTETAPALVGFLCDEEFQRKFTALAGLSVQAKVSVRDASFPEAVLFTHNGLSGPAILQASLHWYPGDSITIDLLPDLDVFHELKGLKQEGSQKTLKGALAQWLPERLAHCLFSEWNLKEGPIANLADDQLRMCDQLLHHWEIRPRKTTGYEKAEVTRGGVATEELHSKTMESRKIPGLYFIGEVVDVTGWLGGYNFQWAWASAYAAADGMASRSRGG